ncbi:sensor histidine kinase [Haliangium sp.]|uniref:sensor histidine kinase n=1 Tax=Haliangium sp. TaxID=2663208 RepID=UPI003D0BD6CF
MSPRRRLFGAVKVRTYGLLLLALIGVVPLTIYGAGALARARRTMAEQVREGHRRLAKAIAERISASARDERRLIATIGVAALHADSAHERALVLDAYLLGYPHLHDVALYDRAGELVAGQVPEAREARYQALAEAALAGADASSEVETSAGGSERFGHSLTIGEPVVLAGALAGAIVARYDLVGLWPAVNSVRVGRTGFIRLLSSDGRLLAHGNPEERRAVFDRVHVDADAALVAAALLDGVGENRAGEEVLASLAVVDGFPGMVVVEQHVSEAFSEMDALERNLLLLAGATLVFTILVGAASGHRLVRVLERMRQHAAALPQDLKRRIDTHSRFVEVQALADGLNQMAADLERERHEAEARARLTTFARVAAGLAHDLRMPIEAVRGAVELVLRQPDDVALRALLERARARDLPRLSRFIDDLQRLAHRGQVGLVYEQIEPLALVRDVAAELRAARKWAGVSFEVGGRADPAEIDKNLVRRALVNLAGNAADACLELAPSGTVTIEVGDGPDDTIELRVVDTGVGMPPERVEELRYGSDFQSTKRTTGVGLGLGVVRQVVSAHSGSLDIRSDPGAGSVFTMRLPRQRPRGDSAQSAA